MDLLSWPPVHRAECPRANALDDIARPQDVARGFFEFCIFVEVIIDAVGAEESRETDFIERLSILKPPFAFQDCYHHSANSLVLQENPPLACQAGAIGEAGVRIHLQRSHRVRMSSSGRHGRCSMPRLPGGGADRGTMGDDVRAGGPA